MNQLKTITLDNKTQLTVSFKLHPEERGQDHFIPKEVSNLKIEFVSSEHINNLCHYIESRHGDFFEELETKILENYD